LDRLKEHGVSLASSLCKVALHLDYYKMTEVNTRQKGKVVHL